jgi:hypothetical protein
MQLVKAVVWVGCLAALGCNSSSVSSAKQAEQAYQGLDTSVQKAMDLGFAGFNAASSANIPPQSTSGNLSGTLTVNGQVDQGASANKGMRLTEDLENYSDGKVTISGESPVSIAYTTNADAGLPALGLSLRGIPNGTFSGTLVGLFDMKGDLSGSVTLNLSMSGNIEAADGGQVVRTPGSTTITGTATSGSGQYTVQVTR